ncbi:hypothetical protein K501DRAFT_288364 [Backusella circina FSU 941]|nr:hypothetical protein K501DRAFT_288364 [Backusella circina FSU 941]
MNRLFNWITNLKNNESPDADGQAEHHESVAQSTIKPTSLPSRHSLHPDRDINMASVESTKDYIDLVSSDEDESNEGPSARDNYIDLTQDDDDDMQPPPSSVSDRLRYRYQGRVTKHRYPNEKHITKRRKEMLGNKIAHEEWIAMTAAKAISGRCSECLYRFHVNNPTLSKRESNGLCKGCYRLHQAALLEGDKMGDVLHWLKTGELSVDVWEDEVDNAKEERLVKKRAGEMKKRFDRKSINRQHAMDLPTQEDLYDLYLDCECKCAVTGWTCHFGRRGQKFWSVTFDHIVPVSRAPKYINPWAISNIQVMCHLLNQIKGNLPDEELRRWFNVWKSAQF